MWFGVACKVSRVARGESAFDHSTSWVRGKRWKPHGWTHVYIEQPTIVITLYDYYNILYIILGQRQEMETAAKRQFFGWRLMSVSTAHN